MIRTGPFTGLPGTMGASGGQIVGQVVTTAECAWSVTSDALWVHIQPSNGQGAAILTVQVDQNQITTSRTAAIDVNGTHMQVTQAAAPPPPPPPPRDPQPEPEPAPPTPSAPIPPAPARLDLSGPVSSLSGSCPTLTFTVRGYRVDTDDDTKFTKGPCKRITNGITLDIAGERRTNGTVYAVRIELEKD